MNTENVVACPYNKSHQVKESKIHQHVLKCCKVKTKYLIYALDVDLHQYSFMPCPFTGPKMFWAGPNVLCQTKNLFTYCGQTKRCFAFCKIGFCYSTNVFEEVLNAVKFLGWHKILGPAQNILVDL